MIKVNPAERLNIDQIMSSTWIAQYVNVARTELATAAILNEDAAQISEINNAITSSLNEMRTEVFQLKRLELSDNPLFKKRKKKE